eukprot:6233169-Amphidinium_carterae.1
MELLMQHVVRQGRVWQGAPLQHISQRCDMMTTGVQPGKVSSLSSAAIVFDLRDSSMRLSHCVD